MRLRALLPRMGDVMGMLRKANAVGVGDLQAAGMNLLFEIGLHAITPEAVAERLGVPVVAVQRAQPRFDELVAEVFQKVVSSELAEVKRAMLRHPEPLDQLAALVDLLAEPVQAEVTAAWCEGFSLSRRNPALATAVRAEQAAWIRCFSFVIERGQRDGVFTTDADPASVAAHMLAMIDGLNASQLAGYDPGVPRRRMLGSIVELGLGVTFSGSTATT